jgi:hypothetical protein
MPIITIKGKSYDLPEDGKIRPSDTPGKAWVQERDAPTPVEVDADFNEVVRLINAASTLSRP